MSSPRLVADAVTCGYGDRTVLHGVSLALGEGEIVGLIGPNGAGKSTLVRVLAGLLTPTAGVVRLDGVPLATRSARERARAIAWVPQDPHVEFPFTVREVVLMGRTPHLRRFGFAGPEDLARAQDAETALGLRGFDHRRLAELSGGERQRVFLARALVQDPAVLLLDEPTTHLDLRHQAMILAVVGQRVRAHGVAALAVLHDLNLAAVVCDRLVLLDRGQVVASGPPDAVLTPTLIAQAFGPVVHVDRHPAMDVPVILPRRPSL